MRFCAENVLYPPVEREGKAFKAYACLPFLLIQIIGRAVVRGVAGAVRRIDSLWVDLLNDGRGTPESVDFRFAVDHRLVLLS
jgi:hypothetical protein